MLLLLEVSLCLVKVVLTTKTYLQETARAVSNNDISFKS
jgi:hypothetical protein